uniref:PHD-finger domain-containing protein n=1 Tax=Toxoplasma gondii TgCATBr9 TaxID=943120 RepID=A0A2T6IDM6_TOXGO|nr:hypothetical protein TGBR9_241850 [Toxoplasma gondii TgCATBr9]
MTSPPRHAGRRSGDQPPSSSPSSSSPSRSSPSSSSPSRSSPSSSSSALSSCPVISQERSFPLQHQAGDPQALQRWRSLPESFRAASPAATLPPFATVSSSGSPVSSLLSTPVSGVSCVSSVSSTSPDPPVSPVASVSPLSSPRGPSLSAVAPASVASSALPSSHLADRDASGVSTAGSPKRILEGAGAGAPLPSPHSTSPVSSRSAGPEGSPLAATSSPCVSPGGSPQAHSPASASLLSRSPVSRSPGSCAAAPLHPFASPGQAASSLKPGTPRVAGGARLSRDELLRLLLIARERNLALQKAELGRLDSGDSGKAGRLSPESLLQGVPSSASSVSAPLASQASSRSPQLPTETSDAVTLTDAIRTRREFDRLASGTSASTHLLSLVTERLAFSLTNVQASSPPPGSSSTPSSAVSSTASQAASPSRVASSLRASRLSPASPQVLSPQRSPRAVSLERLSSPSVLSVSSEKKDLGCRSEAASSRVLLSSLTTEQGKPEVSVQIEIQTNEQARGASPFSGEQPVPRPTGGLQKSEETRQGSAESERPGRAAPAERKNEGRATRTETQKKPETPEEETGVKAVDEAEKKSVMATEETAKETGAEGARESVGKERGEEESEASEKKAPFSSEDTQNGGASCSICGQRQEATDKENPILFCRSCQVGAHLFCLPSQLLQRAYASFKREERRAQLGSKLQEAAASREAPSEEKPEASRRAESAKGNAGSASERREKRTSNPEQGLTGSGEELQMTEDGLSLSEFISTVFSSGTAAHAVAKRESENAQAFRVRDNYLKFFECTACAFSQKERQEEKLTSDPLHMPTEAFPQSLEARHSFAPPSVLPRSLTNRSLGQPSLSSSPAGSGCPLPVVVCGERREETLRCVLCGREGGIFEDSFPDEGGAASVPVHSSCAIYTKAQLVHDPVAALLERRERRRQTRNPVSPSLQTSSLTREAVGVALGEERVRDMRGTIKEVEGEEERVEAKVEDARDGKEEAENARPDTSTAADALAKNRDEEFVVDPSAACPRWLSRCQLSELLLLSGLNNWSCSLCTSGLSAPRSSGDPDKEPSTHALPSLSLDVSSGGSESTSNPLGADAFKEQAANAGDDTNPSTDDLLSSLSSRLPSSSSPLCSAGVGEASASSFRGFPLACAYPGCKARAHAFCAQQKGGLVQEVVLLYSREKRPSSEGREQRAGESDPQDASDYELEALSRLSRSCRAGTSSEKRREVGTRDEENEVEFLSRLGETLEATKDGRSVCKEDISSGDDKENKTSLCRRCCTASPDSSAAGKKRKHEARPFQESLLNRSGRRLWGAHIWRAVLCAAHADSQSLAVARKAAVPGLCRRLVSSLKRRLPFEQGPRHFPTDAAPSDLVGASGGLGAGPRESGCRDGLREEQGARDRETGALKREREARHAAPRSAKEGADPSALQAASGVRRPEEDARAVMGPMEAEETGADDGEGESRGKETRPGGREEETTRTGGLPERRTNVTGENGSSMSPTQPLGFLPVDSWSPSDSRNGRCPQQSPLPSSPRSSMSPASSRSRSPQLLCGSRASESPFGSSPALPVPPPGPSQSPGPSKSPGPSQSPGPSKSPVPSQSPASASSRSSRATPDAGGPPPDTGAAGNTNVHAAATRGTTLQWHRYDVRFKRLVFGVFAPQLLRLMPPGERSKALVASEHLCRLLFDTEDSGLPSTSASLPPPATGLVLPASNATTPLHAPLSPRAGVGSLPCPAGPGPRAPDSPALVALDSLECGGVFQEESSFAARREVSPQDLVSDTGMGWGPVSSEDFSSALQADMSWVPPSPRLRVSASHTPLSSCASCPLGLPPGAFPTFSSLRQATGLSAPSLRVQLQWPSGLPLADSFGFFHDILLPFFVRVCARENAWEEEDRLPRCAVSALADTPGSPSLSPGTEDAATESAGFSPSAHSPPESPAGRKGPGGTPRDGLLSRRASLQSSLETGDSGRGRGREEARERREKPGRVSSRRSSGGGLSLGDEGPKASDRAGEGAGKTLCLSTTAGRSGARRRARKGTPGGWAGADESRDREDVGSLSAASSPSSSFECRRGRASATPSGAEGEGPAGGREGDTEAPGPKPRGDGGQFPAPSKEAQDSGAASLSEKQGDEGGIVEVETSDSLGASLGLGEEDEPRPKKLKTSVLTLFDFGGVQAYASLNVRRESSEEAARKRREERKLIQHYRASLPLLGSASLPGLLPSVCSAAASGTEKGKNASAGGPALSPAALSSQVEKLLSFYEDLLRTEEEDEAAEGERPCEDALNEQNADGELGRGTTLVGETEPGEGPSEYPGNSDDRDSESNRHKIKETVTLDDVLPLAPYQAAFLKFRPLSLSLAPRSAASARPSSSVSAHAVSPLVLPIARLPGLQFATQGVSSPRACALTVDFESFHSTLAVWREHGRLKETQEEKENAVQCSQLAQADSRETHFATPQESQMASENPGDIPRDRPDIRTDSAPVPSSGSPSSSADHETEAAAGCDSADGLDERGAFPGSGLFVPGASTRLEQRLASSKGGPWPSASASAKNRYGSLSLVTSGNMCVLPPSSAAAAALAGAAVLREFDASFGPSAFPSYTFAASSRSLFGSRGAHEGARLTFAADLFNKRITRLACGMSERLRREFLAGNSGALRAWKPGTDLSPHEVHEEDETLLVECNYVATFVAAALLERQLSSHREVLLDRLEKEVLYSPARVSDRVEEQQLILRRYFSRLRWSALIDAVRRGYRDYCGASCQGLCCLACSATLRLSRIRQEELQSPHGPKGGLWPGLQTTRAGELWGAQGRGLLEARPGSREAAPRTAKEKLAFPSPCGRRPCSVVCGGAASGASGPTGDADSGRCRNGGRPQTASWGRSREGEKSEREDESSATGREGEKARSPADAPLSSVCSVCWTSTQDHINRLLHCTCCKVTVHRYCYAVCCSPLTQASPRAGAAAAIAAATFGTADAAQQAREGAGSGPTPLAGGPHTVSGVPFQGAFPQRGAAPAPNVVAASIAAGGGDDWLCSRCEKERRLFGLQQQRQNFVCASTVCCICGRAGGALKSAVFFERIRPRRLRTAEAERTGDAGLAQEGDTRDGAEGSDDEQRGTRVRKAGDREERESEHEDERRKGEKKRRGSAGSASGRGPKPREKKEDRRGSTAASSQKLASSGGSDSRRNGEEQLTGAVEGQKACARGSSQYMHGKGFFESVVSTSASPASTSSLPTRGRSQRSRAHARPEDWRRVDRGDMVHVMCALWMMPYTRCLDTECLEPWDLSGLRRQKRREAARFSRRRLGVWRRRHSGGPRERPDAGSQSEQSGDTKRKRADSWEASDAFSEGTGSPLAAKMWSDVALQTPDGGRDSAKRLRTTVSLPGRKRGGDDSLKAPEAAPNVHVPPDTLAVVETVTEPSQTRCSASALALDPDLSMSMCLVSSSSPGTSGSTPDALFTPLPDSPSCIVCGMSDGFLKRCACRSCLSGFFHPLCAWLNAFPVSTVLAASPRMQSLRLWADRRFCMRGDASATETAWSHGEGGGEGDDAFRGFDDRFEHSGDVSPPDSSEEEEEEIAWASSSLSAAALVLSASQEEGSDVDRLSDLLPERPAALVSSGGDATSLDLAGEASPSRRNGKEAETQSWPPAGFRGVGSPGAQRAGPATQDSRRRGERKTARWGPLWEDFLMKRLVVHVWCPQHAHLAPHARARNQMEQMHYRLSRLSLSQPEGFAYRSMLECAPNSGAFLSVGDASLPSLPFSETNSFFPPGLGSPLHGLPGGEVEASLGTPHADPQAGGLQGSVGAGSMGKNLGGACKKRRKPGSSLPAAFSNFGLDVSLAPWHPAAPARVALQSGALLDNSGELAGAQTPALSGVAPLVPFGGDAERPDGSAHLGGGDDRGDRVAHGEAVRLGEAADGFVGRIEETDGALGPRGVDAASAWVEGSGADYLLREGTDHEGTNESEDSDPLPPDRYPAGVCAICLERDASGSRAPGSPDHSRKEEGHGEDGEKENNVSFSAEGSEESLVLSRLEKTSKRRQRALFSCRGCGVCVHRACYGGRGFRFSLRERKSGTHADGACLSPLGVTSLCTNSSPCENKGTEGDALPVADVEESMKGKRRKERGDTTTQSQRKNESRRAEKGRKRRETADLAVAGTFLCDVCAWGSNPREVSCLLCPRRGGALKAVQPLDSAAAWRRSLRSSSAFLGCWSRPLYVHMFCALLSPFPPVKIARNQELSPVWGVDLLAAALKARTDVVLSALAAGAGKRQTHAGPTKLEGARKEALSGVALCGVRAGQEPVKAEERVGVAKREENAARVKHEASTASGAERKQAAEQSALSRDEATEEMLRKLGQICAFCGRVGGLLLQCAFRHPGRPHTSRECISSSVGRRHPQCIPHELRFEKRETGKEESDCGEGGDMTSCCAGLEIFARKTDPHRCLTRFHPICAYQRGIHVSWCAAEDCRAFFFCREHSEQIQRLPPSVSRLLDVYRLLLQHRALLHDMVHVEQDYTHLLDIEEELKQQEALQVQLLDLWRRQENQKQLHAQKMQQKPKKKTSSV